MEDYAYVYCYCCNAMDNELLDGGNYRISGAGSLGDPKAPGICNQGGNR